MHFLVQSVKIHLISIKKMLDRKVKELPLWGFPSFCNVSRVQ
jgi:hypothetical protein